MKHGVIYHRNITMRMFVVKLDDEKYTVFESHDITSFNVGDKVYGSLEKNGLQTILHARTLKWHTVNIHAVNHDANLAILKANFIDQRI